MKSVLNKMEFKKIKILIILSFLFIYNESSASVASSVEKLGFPEARIPLAQAVIYVAQAPKDNSAIVAIDKALDDIQNKGHSYPVPDHLKDTHYKDAKSKYGFGVDYKYPHDFPGSTVEQEYLPKSLKDRKYIPEKK